MIKFHAEGDGRMILGVGLSTGNVTRLMAGQPIVVKLSDINGPENVDVLIFFGRTEEEMAAALRQFVTAETKVYPIEEPDDHLKAKL